MGKVALFNNSNIDMTKGSVAGSLILFATPILVSDFLQQCYNVVDSLIVGNYVSKQALAAVGETFFIINIFLGIFLGISLGPTIIMTGCYVVLRQIYLAIRWINFKNILIVVAGYHFSWTVCAVLMLSYLIIREKQHLKLENGV